MFQSIAAYFRSSYRAGGSMHGLGFILATAWLSAAGVCWAAVDARVLSLLRRCAGLPQEGRYQRRYIQLKNAIRADESNVDARFDLAAIYLSRSDGANAEKELRAALAHGMTRERALLPLAQALILQNKTEALLKEIDPAIIRGHDAAVLHGLRARANLMLKQLDAGRDGNR